MNKQQLGEIATRVTRKNENLESILPLTISAQYGLVMIQVYGIRMFLIVQRKVREIMDC